MTAKQGYELDQRAIEEVRVMMSLSIEERLRHVRECCRLLADLFNIQAEAAFLACEVSLSTDAYNALTTICRTSADDLERLVREMPPSLANWHGEAIVDRL
jgi:hypothetical protein